MRVLTLASVILLPSVVLAGIMGMNFKVGLFDNPNLFWVVIGLMVVMAAADPRRRPLARLALTATIDAPHRGTHEEPIRRMATTAASPAARPEG